MIGGRACCFLAVSGTHATSIPAHHSRRVVSVGKVKNAGLSSHGFFFIRLCLIWLLLLRFGWSNSISIASSAPSPYMMDARIATAGAGIGGGAGTCAVGGFVTDVVLWRRGRADVSACLLAATVSSWLLFYGGYTLLSLASNVLLLLLTVLFLWAKAARLLNRPQPPVPELRVPQQAVDEAAALLRSALDAACHAFRDIALARDSLLFCRAFLCLWSVSIVGSLTDFPTACYASIVAALTIPALYHRHQECIHTYMSFAYMNLRMYEMVYERLSMKCFLRVRGWIMELLKDP